MLVQCYQYYASDSHCFLLETLRLWPPVPLDYRYITGHLLKTERTNLVIVRRETIKPDVWTAEDGTRYFIPAKMWYVLG